MYVEKNIFGGQSTRALFAHYVYEELRKREFVSLVDILCIYYKRDKYYYDLHTYSSDKAYAQLKKAFPEVIHSLEQVEPGCIIDNGKSGKGKAFKYIGKEDDPLAEEKKAIVQKSVEDYVMFCKASAGILPASWFSSFFENTQLLLETNRDAESGISLIRLSLEQNLTNIHLLPLFYKAITDHHVLRFSYQRFGQEPFELIFHQQFLKEYNGRWFVFGEANREPYRAYNVPLDRIVSEIDVVDDVEYIPADIGFYQRYFKDIVGVTHLKDAIVEQIVIRTKTVYHHGLMLTKPLHYSQKEIKPFDHYEDGCYGELSLMVEPNRELQGKILSYGQFLDYLSITHVEYKRLTICLMAPLPNQLLPYYLRYSTLCKNIKTIAHG